MPILVYWLLGGSVAAVAGGYFVKSTGEAAQATGAAVEEASNATLKLVSAGALALVAIYAAKKAKVL